MRVALITSGAQSVANFRGTLIEELVSRGAEVIALAPDWDKDSIAATQRLGAKPMPISLSRVGLDPLRDVMDLTELVVTLRRLRLDAALTYFAKPNVYGTLAAWMAGVPRRIAMVEGLGFAFENTAAPTRKAKIVSYAAKSLFRTAFARAHRVIFLNRDDEGFFRDQALVAPGKIMNIGGIGVDLQAFAPTKPVLDPPTFLLMARLLRGKGILEFAEAASRVKAMRPSTRFILLGAPDANPDSLQAADVAPWVDCGAIEWPGHVSDVRAILSTASVFVLPAWCREGLPRSTQEAAAMGKPIITTDVIGCRDTVVDGVNGFMIPGRDVDSLVEAMMRFIENSDLIVSMGHASRKIAEERWDGRVKSAALADVLLNIAD